MSGFAHLPSNSVWGEKLLPPIKSRIGVRGISRCTTKALHARFAKQLRQLMTRVEHSRLDGVYRNANSASSELVLMNGEDSRPFTTKCFGPPRRSDVLIGNEGATG